VSVVRARLGEILVSTGVVTAEQVDEALAVQSQKGGRIGEVLIGLKRVDETDVAQALARQLGLTCAPDLTAHDVDTELASRVPIAFAKRYGIVPLGREDGSVRLAVTDPLDLTAIDQVAKLVGLRPRLVVTSPRVLLEVVNRTYDVAGDSARDMIEDLDIESLDTLAHELEEPEDLLDADSEAPIIRLLNTLMAQAVKERASDIHIEPFERDLVVRYRIDGILHDVLRPPKRIQSSITSRAKIMAGLNIAEKRLPQDGRIRIKIGGKDIDIRMSVIPVAHGERIVMRLLDKATVVLDLQQLGLLEDHRDTIEKLIHKPNGIFLVTGPTGSGKTTTLYAGITRINSVDKNIITVEDPIEYQLRGIGQIQVHPKIGLSFASGLRSILRQDPDVILVGEIRDLETAEIAIQASLTGHLVFSTLHTNDAPGAVTRLVDMGVEAFLVASSLLGVLAQRLVRVICTHCKKPYHPTPTELEELGVREADLPDGVLWKGVGCNACMRTGYKGRTGIYELFVVNDAVREAILGRGDTATVRRAALATGMLTLRGDGSRKVVRGITTVEEVIRVTQDVL